MEEERFIPIGFDTPPLWDGFLRFRTCFFRVAKNKLDGTGALPVGPNVGFGDGAKRPAACGEVPDTASPETRRFIPEP